MPADTAPTPEEILASRFVSTENSVQIVTGFQRYARPIFDYETKFAPCRGGCPAGHDIAAGLFLVAQGRLDLALELFHQDSPFPAVTGRVCYHPCEAVCNRGDHDQSLAINMLERALADGGSGPAPEPPVRRHNETIGIIGSGPAGLTCAYHLQRLGYATTVYEADAKPGGVLQYGIPRYRLPREVLQRELDRLAALGIEFRCGTRIGADLSLAELRQAHNALFLGLGLGRSRRLPTLTTDHERIRPGLAFLREVSEGAAPRLGPSVAIIGGGDVAIDAARSARRLGATRVMVCALEPRAGMLAHREEVDAALSEGIEIINEVSPVEITADSRGASVTLGRITNLRRTPGGELVWDQAGAALQPIAASLVLTCIGQEPDCDFLPGECWQDARITVNAVGQTRLPDVFAGGDVTGVYNVVNAIGTAKRAVIGIDAYLRGRDGEQGLACSVIGGDGSLSMEAYRKWREGESEPVTPRRQVSVGDINLDYFPKALRPQLPRSYEALRARDFDEVNLTLSEQQAIAEAKRCFNCGLCNMCGNCFLFCPDSSVVQNDTWGFAIDLDHCKGCGVCVEECPRCAMTMVSEYEMETGESEADSSTGPRPRRGWSTRE